ncbi:uncharacterized protein [Hetaerina americana]|uniref:uncharacterized protein n=1 Tax=Hetaerina americana TaxID=62018 RepID=UPI003A7F3150
MERCRRRLGVTSCLVSVFMCSLLMQTVHSSAISDYRPHDIHDALRLIGATMSNYGDKLERHEGRERQLGDTLRRALSAVDKRVALLQRSSEERHRELERFLIQVEERERIQLQKATLNIESLGSMLETRLRSIEALLQANPKSQGDGAPTETACVKLLEPKVESLQQKLESVEETVRTETTKLNYNMNKFEEGLVLNIDKSGDILEYLINTDNNNKKNGGSAGNHPEKSEEIKGLMTLVSNRLDSINTQSLEARQDTIQAINRTMMTLEQIREDIKTVNTVQSEFLVQKLNDVQNTTLSAIEQASQEFEAKGNDSDACQINENLMSLKERLGALSELTEASKTELQMEVRHVSNRIKLEASGVRDAVLKKMDDAMEILSPTPLLKILTDIENVMLQAADGVMDVRRRVDHGNLRVINELGEEIKSTSSSMESTISSRLDNLAASVLVNQTGAMETLSQKVESEISQVWRQIGIMYQQLTQSVGMLDKLQVQTENYVNGSLKSMGSVEGRVGEIGERVGEVEGNLNFLIGRLSLVSTEFNVVKVGLAKALDDVRQHMALVNNNMMEVPKGTEYDHVNQVSPNQDE